MTLIQIFYQSLDCHNMINLTIQLCCTPLQKNYALLVFVYLEMHRNKLTDKTAIWFMLKKFKYVQTVEKQQRKFTQYTRPQTSNTSI